MIDRAHEIWHIYGTVDEVIVIHWVNLAILGFCCLMDI